MLDELLLLDLITGSWVVWLSAGFIDLTACCVGWWTSCFVLVALFCFVLLLALALAIAFWLVS